MIILEFLPLELLLPEAVGFENHPRCLPVSLGAWSCSMLPRASLGHLSLRAPGL